MKIPKGYFRLSDKEPWKELFGLWHNTALQISIEYGILVEVGIEMESSSGNWTSVGNRGGVIYPDDVIRLFFQTSEKQFEGLDQLRRALKNKAFL